MFVRADFFTAALLAFIFANALFLETGLELVMEFGNTCLPISNEQCVFIVAENRTWTRREAHDRQFQTRRPSHCLPGGFRSVGFLVPRLIAVLFRTSCNKERRMRVLTIRKAWNRQSSIGFYRLVNRLFLPFSEIRKKIVASDTK